MFQTLFCLHYQGFRWKLRGAHDILTTASRVVHIQTQYRTLRATMCILKGRVCGLFSTAACRPIVPFPHWVPLIHLQRRHTPHRHERPLPAKEGSIQGILLAHRNSRRFKVLLHVAKLGHRTDSFTSLRRKACGGFFRCPKNPTTSARFKSANSGTRGQHANH